MKISKITQSLLLASTIAIILVLSRGDAFKQTGISYLIWNLFLAWIPYVISLLYITNETPTLTFIATFALWLVFFPNAPYLATDVIHIYGQTGSLSFNSLIFFFFGWIGLMLGMISLLNIHTYLEKHFKKILSESIIFFICILSSFGIYLGRFERWNSWDLLSHPREISHGFYTASTHTPTLVFVITFTCISYSAYKTIRALYDRENKTA